ncbi:NmrA family transcriptional regulator [Streptomyces sp. NPDC056716]|uniref:NmrA family transcriptional regulator n=1 Tax=unclassified Streptomyces TaxID=2593676 RepID=UPI0036935869
MAHHKKDIKDTKDMTLVVTGASGRTGRRVAAAASGAGLTVRAASRARGFDWNDRTTWADTLRGADAAYLAHPADVGAPEATLAVGLLAHEAVALGVRRLVLLSGRGEEQARPTEEALRESGADWTVVRSAWFMQNFSEGLLADQLRGGELVFPAGGVREPFVDLQDVADVVVTALTSGDTYVRTSLDVSGGQLLTWGEAVAEIAAVSGRDLAFRSPPMPEYGEALAGFGLPPEEVAFLLEVFEGLLDGRNAHLSEGIREVLGRAPRTFSEFVRESAAAGVWQG